MALVHHRGHTIKAEAIKIIYIQPILAVRQEEVQHLILAIVEAQTIPCWVLTTRTAVEILIWRAIEIAQTLQLVLHCV